MLCPVCRKELLPNYRGFLIYSANECPVCLQTSTPVVALPCGHIVCCDDFRTLSGLCSAGGSSSSGLIEQQSARSSTVFPNASTAVTRVGSNIFGEPVVVDQIAPHGQLAMENPSTVFPNTSTTIQITRDGRIILAGGAITIEQSTLHGQPHFHSTVSVDSNNTRNEGQGNVSVHGGALVDPSARFGRGCTVYAAAHIQPRVQVQQNCSFFGGCVIQSGCTIGSNCNFYGGCVVGHNATIGSNCEFHGGAVVRSGAVVPDGTRLLGGQVYGW